MASRIFSLVSIRPQALGLGVGLGCSAFAATTLLQPHQRLRQSMLIRCDAAARPFSDYQRDAKVPVVRSGRVNPKAFRQVSAGSIAGLLGGVAVSVFSKPLALLIGLLVIGAQVLESKGIHLVPYSRLQRYFKNTDIKSAVQDNVAFKLSFGLTFALAAFAEF